MSRSSVTTLGHRKGLSLAEQYITGYEIPTKNHEP